MTIAVLKAEALSLAQAARIAKRLEHQRQERARQSRNYFREKASDPAADTPTILDQIATHEEERRDLHRHRTHVVRAQARAVHLARGFFRGTSYKAMEAKCWSPPQWHDVETLIKGSVEADTLPVVLQKYAEWRDAAGRWVQPPAKPSKHRSSTWVSRPVTLWLPANTIPEKGDLVAGYSANG